MTSFLIVAGCGLAACGGSSTPAPTTMPMADEAGDHAEHHDGMPAEVHTFHEILAPHWHAELGQARMDATCADADTMSGDARAIADAAVPADADATAWADAASKLVDQVGALATACTSDLATFNSSFESMHNGFHALIALLPHGEG